MPVSIETRKAFKFHKHGDLAVVLTWVNDERAMLVFPWMREKPTWFVLPDRLAYLWGVDDPDPIWSSWCKRRAWGEAATILGNWGVEATPHNRARLVAIITGWIPDLYRMPSAPPPEFKPGSWGQQIMRADGVPFAAEELRDEVEGVTYG